MPFGLDKLTDKFGEMMKEKLGGGQNKEHESTDSSYDEHKSYGEHQESYGHGGNESYRHSYSAPPPGPPSSNVTLPPGWMQQWDANSQRYYYVEQATGRTQWDPPVVEYGPPSGAHPPGGSVPYEYHGHDERAMHAGYDSHGSYEGSHGEEKKKDSHTGLAFAGGAALGAVGGAWAAHEYTEHEEEEKHAAEAAQYHGDSSGYGGPASYGAPPADPTMNTMYVPEEGQGSDVESEAESVNEAADDVHDAQEEVAEASSESDREEALEDLEEAQEEYHSEREDYQEEVAEED